MEGAKAEPDSMHTPRIAAVFNGNMNPIYLIGIIEHRLPVKVFQIEPKAGTMAGISTYKGDLDNPEPFPLSSELPRLEFKGRIAAEIARHLFDISCATHKGDDIRVCSVGGVLVEGKCTWDSVIVNVHQN
jgi:IMP cyclohydrolase